MTTVVYKDGVMAADCRAYAGDKVPIGRKSKIHRLDDGSLCGVSSSKVGAPEAFLRLVRERGTAVTFDKEHLVQAVVVKLDGSIFYFNDGEGFSGPISAEYIAIGSGEQFALGALKMGAGAARAVEVACECDPWTGIAVETMRLSDA